MTAESFVLRDLLLTATPEVYYSCIHYQFVFKVRSQAPYNAKRRKNQDVTDS